MRIRFNISAILFFSTLLFGIVSCGDDEKKTEEDFFKYLPKEHAERQFTFDNGKAFYITLPDCYKNAGYRQFSITNEENYHCQENQSYFSVDRFTPSDISYYEKYFNEDSTNQYSNKELLLKYVLQSRASNLNIHSESIFSEVTNGKGMKLTLAAIKGSETNYSNPLYYQYAMFSIDKDYFVLQFIVNEGDISFFHEDIMKIFKSIRRV